MHLQLFQRTASAGKAGLDIAKEQILLNNTSAAPSCPACGRT